ncbi:hypothetical protein T440DRAFT_469174 [Plenodomus tracheiphilus IPT5]|uniref:Uncharacterized protein n=1 Tax=Plenodomus tracheiphilus IPT5 TaxID=1408161 RepID=A0A6A7B5Y9_9PLEO|nr:hypothetical protein T440DRAFT_469174 [Plenodomus tracheiphilus IPT5]
MSKQPFVAPDFWVHCYRCDSIVCWPIFESTLPRIHVRRPNAPHWVAPGMVEHWHSMKRNIVTMELDSYSRIWHCILVSSSYSSRN